MCVCELWGRQGGKRKDNFSAECVCVCVYMCVVTVSECFLLFSQLVSFTGATLVEGRDDGVVITLRDNR